MPEIDSAESCYQRSREQVQANLVAEAIDSVREAIRLDDSQVRYWHHLGNLVMRSGDLDQAEQIQLQALSLEPENALTHELLSHVYVRMEDFSRAIDSVEKAIELDASNAGFRHHLANIYQKSGDTKQAEALHKSALAIRADLPGPHYHLSRIYADRGRLGEAVEHAVTAAGLDENHAWYQHHAGVLLFEQGCYEEARACLQRALQLDSSLEAARQQLEVIDQLPEKATLDDQQAVPEEKNTVMAGIKKVLGIFGADSAQAAETADSASVKIIFLHSPKTAGQSVRKMLDEGFPGEVSPARSNEDLLTYSVDELNAFRVTAPHGDWALMDAIERPKYTFTVFRNPMDRILSYYFFLLNKAGNMPEEERLLPHHQGLNAVYTKSPDEYFFADVPHLKAFTDDVYDNFFTYYFAGRTLDARRKLRNLVNRNMISEEKIIDNAIANIRTLDDIFRMDQLDLVKNKIEQLSGKSLTGDYLENINKNEKPGQRQEKLRELGASDRVFDYLQHCCQLDNRIWEFVQENT
jgi:tetratricopeptide (TPR) repeat protein